jgi:tryptophan synthase beta chain
MTAFASGLDGPRLLADSIAGKFPDSHGRFGPFGGRYVPETLIPALERLEQGVREHLHARDFQAAFTRELRTWVGRPTALTFAGRLSERWGAKVYLKREDLAHTGAHKINNAIGQALLAKKIGAKRIVAETGAGQHGVASAAACARLGLPCTVYMGAIDMERQAPNVGRMRLLGAEVVPVTTGDRTLRAAIDESLRAWVSDPLDTYYLIGSAVGPHPYPYLVRELQAVIGREARAQMIEETGALPDAVIACVGGGSNSIGAFHAFVPGAGRGSGTTRPHCPSVGPASCTAASPCCCRMRTARSRKRIPFPRDSIIPGSVPNTLCCSRRAASSIRP